MPQWELDRDRYKAEVIKATADGWDPAENWFRFVQLPLGTDDEGLIKRALDQVSLYLNQMTVGGGALREAANSLVARIPEARAVLLLDPTARAAHRTDASGGLQHVRDRIRSAVGDVRAVPARAVTAFARQSGGRATASDVRDLLAELGIAEREPVALDAPPLTGRDRLGDQLRRLRLGSVGAYLRARGLGADPSEQALDEQDAVVDSRLSGAERTAEEQVLIVLRRWRREGTLRDLLRRDTLDALVRLAERGQAAVEEALRPPDVRRYNTALGLPGPDELAYAVVCLQRFPAEGGPPRWQADVDAAVADRDLRRALELLRARGDLPAEYARLRDDLAHTLAASDRQTAEARAIERDDPEAAAEIYAAVLAVCVHPEAESGLERCRPAAVPSVRAEVVDGERVRVEWEPSPARVGAIAYTVTRGDDAVVERTTTGRSAVDRQPPAAVALSYTVTTLRDGRPGGAATAAPVTVLPRVTDLVLIPGDGAVELRWTLPGDASDAEVTRVTADDPHETPLGRARHEWPDATARNGTEYEYRVRARYRVGLAEPAVGSVRPGPPPPPVSDLRVGRDGDGLLLTWTPPPHGSVRILRCTAPPAHPSGHPLPRAAGERLGEEITGTPVGAGLHIDNPPAGQRYWLLPITVSDHLAVLGTAVPYDARLPAVTGLTVKPWGYGVRLSWSWPPHATEARVYHKRGSRIGEPPDAEAVVERVARAAYERDGCVVRVTEGEWWFGVGLVAVDGGEELAGPVEQCSFTIRLRELEYAIRPVGWWQRWRRSIEVRATQGTVPAVQVRARADLPPLYPDDGHQIARFPAPDAAADVLRGEFTAQPDGAVLHLRAFALDAPDVVLTPAGPQPLRVGAARERPWRRPRPDRRRGTRCPHCWKDVPTVLRRCPAVCGQAGEFFPRTQTLCPHGVEPSTASYCPNPECHKRLEHDYITSRSRVIATIGSGDSGKSTWIGVLVRELRNRGREFGGMTTELVGDASKERYRTVFEKALFTEGRTVARNDSIRAAKGMEPLLIMTRRPLVSRWPRRSDRLLVGMNVFYDAAGEDLLRRENLDLLARYVNGADAIVFALDPLQLPSVRAAVGSRVPLPDQAPDQADMLIRVAELIREHRGHGPDVRISTPLAVVVTKTDALDPLPAGSVLRRPGTPKGGYDEAEGQRMHDEVRALIAEWPEGRHLLDVVDSTFADCRFFAVSALGTPPATPTELAGRIHPLRAEDPMLWLLARFGLVPRR